MRRKIEYIIWQKKKVYLAKCLKYEISSVGETIDEAVENLKETGNYTSRRKS